MPGDVPAWYLTGDALRCRGRSWSFVRGAAGWRSLADHRRSVRRVAAERSPQRPIVVRMPARTVLRSAG